MMIRKLYIFILFALLLVTGKTILAQNVQAFAMLDTSKILIGEQAKIDLYINYNGSDKSVKIQWPQVGDSLASKIEVVNTSKIDTTIPDKNDPQTIQQHQAIYITSFDSGMYIIPGFKFIVNGDTSKPALTQDLLFEVQTIPTDTSDASIKGIKSIYDEPFDWKEYLPYAYWGLGILAVLAIIYYFIYRYRKSRKKKPVEIVKPKIPPHITALRDLETIRGMKLWQEGKIKEYYTAVTDVVRVYIEGRYEVAAMELTSVEIMAVMKNQVIDSVSKEKLQQMLSLADMVKFAKATPIDLENEMLINNAFDFVKGTMREEITPENSQFNKPETK